MQRIDEIGFVFSAEVQYQTNYKGIDDKNISTVREITGLVLSKFSDGHDIALLIALNDLIKTYDMEQEVKQLGIMSLQKYISNLQLISSRFLGPTIAIYDSPS